MDQCLALATLVKKLTIGGVLVSGHLLPYEPYNFDTSYLDEQEWEFCQRHFLDSEGITIREKRVNEQDLVFDSSYYGGLYYSLVIVRET